MATISHHKIRHSELPLTTMINARDRRGASAGLRRRGGVEVVVDSPNFVRGTQPVSRGRGCLGEVVQVMNYAGK